MCRWRVEPETFRFVIFTLFSYRIVMKPPLMKLWTADFMKPTSFRVSLQYNIIRYEKGQINWFDRITDNLYLGAIPLKKSSTTGSQGHLGDVPKKLSELNIKAVISCNEEFERVVTPSVAEWEQLGIHQYRVRIFQHTALLNSFR